MSNQKNCETCVHEGDYLVCTGCIGRYNEPPSRWAPNEQYTPMTNADRIRAMTDEELAEIIYKGVSSDPCDYCKHNNLHCDGSPCQGKSDVETIIDWLQQPCRGADHEP